jgi:hypothetical protein
MINHASIIAFMKVQGTLVIIGFVGTHRIDYLQTGNLGKIKIIFLASTSKN